ncbi:MULTISPECIES: sensor histidine kinase [Microbacterium]|uniref:sensor histidine kinase n=1 Tax=Microbacterium TaxID=33882 RepID=UPI001E44B236|nr:MULTISPECIES: GAF domain-containing sensor histidine kinase [Microbacterium]MBM7826000.1 signal transduction histidine kinase [Microbacterium aurum]
MQTVEDRARVEAIADYGIVGAPVEPSLVSLAQLAATLCQVPTAVVNIIDDRAQHQVAAVGFDAGVCGREDSMCAVVLQDARHVLVPDAQRDRRFTDNPFVTGELGRVRFYASSPLITPAGISIGTLCVFDEATGSLTAEQSAALDLLAHQAVEVLELRRLTQELERSNGELAHFAGQVSHDLRNPLTALVGHLDLAAEAAASGALPRIARAVDQAEAAATRMEGMITDLLAYARAGGAQPRRDRSSLREIVATALDDLSAAIAAAEASVTATIAEETDTVVGDPMLLSLLVQNLVANAVKFALATGIRPLVEITAVRTEQGWSLTVDDNGPGVPADQRDRVFGAMERGDERDVPGLGLGLATCRRIVQIHGGRIAIDDSPLGGARLRVTLRD